MKEYEGIYEEICRYIGFGTPISIWTLGHRKMPISSLYMGLGTWKNFKLCLYISLYNIGSGTWKILTLMAIFPTYRYF